MSKKRILISQLNLSGINSGVQRKVHEEIKYFSSRGHDVIAVAEKINRNAINASGGTAVKTLRWPLNGYLRRLNYIYQTNRVIKKTSPDLVIGHGDIITQDICYIHNCVHLAHEKIYGQKLPLKNAVGRIHRKILEQQNFKLLVCNSELMKKDLTNRFNIPMDKVTVVYPEYDADKFQPDDHGLRAEYREKFGFSDDDIVLGFITSGNFRKRNLNLLIDAAVQLQRQGTRGFKILVAGKDNATPYHEKIRSHGLENTFIFAPSIAKVEAYYHSIDIFVLPALIEEFGRSVLEAMGCGKPVVISNTVGCCEILDKTSRNFVLHDMSSEEMARKLKTLVEDRNLRRQLGETNHRIAKENSHTQRDRDFGNILKKVNFNI